MSSETLLKKLNGNFSEEELADIARIMVHQYLSRNSNPNIISYFDNEKRYVAFRTTPTNGNGYNENGNSNLKTDGAYVPIALNSFYVEVE